MCVCMCVGGGRGGGAHVCVRVHVAVYRTIIEILVSSMVSRHIHGGIKLY